MEFIHFSWINNIHYNTTISIVRKILVNPCYCSLRVVIWCLVIDIARVVMMEESVGTRSKEMIEINTRKSANTVPPVN